MRGCMACIGLIPTAPYLRRDFCCAHSTLAGLCIYELKAQLTATTRPQRLHCSLHALEPVLAVASFVCVVLAECAAGCAAAVVPGPYDKSTRSEQS